MPQFFGHPSIPMRLIPCLLLLGFSPLTLAATLAMRFVQQPLPLLIATVLSLLLLSRRKH